MILERVQSLVHADKVRAELNKLEDIDIRAYLEVWSNGREQGYYLLRNEGELLHDSKKWRACVFAENRSSSEIVVICGPYPGFDSRTHQPTEELFRRAKYFDEGREADAALYIAEFLANG